MATQWTLDDLYRRIARSWWVLVLTVIVAAAGAVGVYVAYPQTYTATAQHTVEPISVLSSGSSFNTVNMETERIIATSASVLDRASTALGGASVDALRDATIIDVPRNSQVLIFQVTTRSAERSAEWANALAVAYGEQRTANARTVVEQTAEELSASIDRIRGLMNSQPAESPEREATAQQLQALLDQQVRVTATPFFSGLLVTPASAPSQSNRPGVYVFVAAGVFLGLLLGSVLALTVSRLRAGATTSYRRGRRDAERGDRTVIDGFAERVVPRVSPSEGVDAGDAVDAADDLGSDSASRPQVLAQHADPVSADADAAPSVRGVDADADHDRDDRSVERTGGARRADVVT